MRAIQVTRHGGPDVLELVETTVPEPGPGDLLVRTEAIGVNFIDTYFREGLYPREAPFIAGDEGAGVIEAIGSDVTGFSVGERVAWTGTVGGYAELVVVPSGIAVHVPAGIDPKVAASTLAQGLTAHYLATSTYEIQPGDDVLIHAGAGGVGLLLTQLATSIGARVITTVSTDEKEQRSREAGAVDVLRYDEDIAARVRELTGGAGVAVTYDGVGASTFDASLAATRVRGTVVLFGAASGPVPRLDPQRLNAAGSLFLTRPTLKDHLRDRAELDWRAGEILDAVADGTLRVHVGAEFALADAADAHRALQGRRTTGAIVLLP